MILNQTETCLINDIFKADLKPSCKSVWEGYNCTCERENSACQTFSDEYRFFYEISTSRLIQIYNGYQDFFYNDTVERLPDIEFLNYIKNEFDDSTVGGLIHNLSDIHKLQLYITSFDCTYSETETKNMKQLRRNFVEETGNAEYVYIKNETVCADYHFERQIESKTRNSKNTSCSQ